MSIDQVDAVFSSTRKCGAEQDISKWSDLGIGGSLADQNIQLFGRNSVSGTYGYFKEVALCKGDFKNGVNEQPGSASVVQSVSTSLNALGYSGIGYKTASVRALPLSKNGTDYVEPTPENAVTGAYPLARSLYVYINKKPGQDLQPLDREFLKLVLSKVGQEVVVKDGYIPLPAKVVEKQMKDLGL
jgi:phosphate transport system substrate-binding protein